jgi:flagellar motor switch protein FliM
MTSLLNDDQVAALVAAAREGRIPDDRAGAARRRGQRIRPLDFRRPTKFTPEQQRRLRTAHQTFCRTVATRLGAEYRLSLDIELINISQLTWINAHAAIPSGSLCGVLRAEPMGTPMLLSIELPLALSFIEVFTGGTTPINAPHERRLTDIDTALARHFLGVLTEQLSGAWQDLAEVSLDLASVDAVTDVAQLTMASEPTLALTIEVRLNRSSSTIGVLVPYRSIEAVEHRIVLRDVDPGAAHGAAAAAMRAAVQEVELELRAEIGRVELPAAQVLDLREGDVIELDGLTDDGVALLAGEVSVGRARPGRNGTLRAVQVIGGGTR